MICETLWKKLFGWFSGANSIIFVLDFEKIMLVSPAPCAPTIVVAELNKPIWFLKVISVDLIFLKPSFFKNSQTSSELIIWQWLNKESLLSIYIFSLIFLYSALAKNFSLNQFIIHSGIYIISSCTFPFLCQGWSVTYNTSASICRFCLSDRILFKGMFRISKVSLWKLYFNSGSKK